MPNSPETIAQQRELLRAHRQYIHRLRQRKATQGIETPPSVDVEITEREEAIAAIKAYLRNIGQEVVDLPEDSTIILIREQKIEAIQEKQAQLETLKEQHADPAQPDKEQEIEALEAAIIRDKTQVAVLDIAANPPLDNDVQEALKRSQPGIKPNKRDNYQDDVRFFVDMLAKTLERVTTLEFRQDKDDQERKDRQVKQDKEAQAARRQRTAILVLIAVLFISNGFIWFFVLTR